MLLFSRARCCCFINPWSLGKNLFSTPIRAAVLLRQSPKRFPPTPPTAPRASMATSDTLPTFFLFTADGAFAPQRPFPKLYPRMLGSTPVKHSLTLTGQAGLPPVKQKLLVAVSNLDCRIGGKTSYFYTRFACFASRISTARHRPE